MATVPEGIVLKRHRDLEDPGYGVTGRRATMAAICLLLVLALFNVFGQRPRGTHVSSPAAELELYAPAHLRSGLLFEARLTIRPRRDLEHAQLELSPGWSEGMQMNTIEPSPTSETSRDGSLLFGLGPIAKGHVYRLFMQFQVNPTNVGRRSADVALLDGTTTLLTVKRTLTVWP